MARLPLFTSGAITQYGVLRMPPFASGEGQPSSFSISMAGGAKCAGTATVQFIDIMHFSMTMSGGTLVGGTADIPGPMFWTMSGGALVGGSALIPFFFNASGGVTLGGAAPNELVSNSIAGSFGSITCSSTGEQAPYIIGSFGGITGDLEAATGGIAGVIGGLYGENFVSNIDGVFNNIGAIVGEFGGITFNGLLNSAVITGEFGAITFDSTAEVGVTGSIDGALLGIASDLTGYQNTFGTITGSFGQITSVVVSYTGLTGMLRGTIQLTGKLTAYQTHDGTIGGEFGRIIGALTGYFDITGTVTGEFGRILGTLIEATPINSSIRRVVVVNTANGAVTEYPDVAFNSACVFGGRLLLAGATGIYAVGAGAVDAVVRTGRTDYKSIQQKRLDNSYVGYTSANDLQFSVIAEASRWDYALPKRNDNYVQVTRANIGKGIRDRYFQYEVTNPGGADFKLYAIDVTAVQVSRRI